MSRHFRWLPAVALALVLPLAACGGDDEPDMDEMEEIAPAPAPEMEAPDMMQPMTVTLDSKNESGVTGRTTATYQGDSLTLVVDISGATEDGEFAAHVHSGDCENTGAPLAPLTSLTVSGGSGSSTTTIAQSVLQGGQPAVVQVHAPSGSPVACGDMEGHGDMGGMGMEGDTTGM